MLVLGARRTSLPHPKTHTYTRVLRVMLGRPWEAVRHNMRALCPGTRDCAARHGARFDAGADADTASPCRPAGLSLQYEGGGLPA